MKFDIFVKVKIKVFVCFINLFSDLCNKEQMLVTYLLILTSYLKK